MDTKPDNREARAKNMAFMGVISGVIALMMFSDPSMSLLFGAIAIILAWLSHTYIKHYTRTAIAALVLGIIGVLLSLFVFFNFMLAINIMDDTEAIASSMDPAAADQFREMINYYKDILSGSAQ